MSGIVDTNILLYAANQNADEHRAAQEFIMKCGQEASLHFLTEAICYEFLRVSTHPRVFPKPLTAQKAMDFLSRLLRSNRFEVLSAGPNHWEHLKKILKETAHPEGNLFFDIRTVALMHEHTVRCIYTADTDFLQFSGIEVVNPCK